jgi:hypothetical protein
LKANRPMTAIINAGRRNNQTRHSMGARVFRRTANQVIDYDD